jgi:signal transduction histidine kinase
MFDERKQAEEQIQRKAARITALSHVAARLNAQLDLDKVLQAVCEETAYTLDVPAALMMLYEPSSKAFFPVAFYGLPAGIRPDIAPVSHSLYKEHVRQVGPLVVVPDVQATPDLPNSKLWARYNIRTLASISVMREGELIGTLNIFTMGEPRIFDDEEVTLLKGLAHQAALAIANARLFAQVRQQRERLHALGARLAEAEEAERRRLARELHDQVGQNLTALGINLNIVRAQMPETASPLQSRLEDSLALVEQTTERVRSVMAELRPPVLDDYGLMAALRWYGERFSSRASIAVDVQGIELDPRLTLPVENALFRIAQEALTNVTKHAQAAHVTVTVEELNRTTVRLVIADDGIGFDPARLAESNERQRWGLLTMAERAEAVKGYCRVESRPEQGTRVVVEVPR